MTFCLLVSVSYIQILGYLKGQLLKINAFQMSFGSSFRDGKALTTGEAGW